MSGREYRGMLLGSRKQNETPFSGLIPEKSCPELNVSQECLCASI